MRITVCQLDGDHPEGFNADWAALAAHVRAEKSELVLLPEMPFSSWFAGTREFDARVWEEAVRLHRAWEVRLGELGAAAVLASRPQDLGGRRVNQAYAWQAGSLLPAHEKYYLPDEERFWEASWYGRGDGNFDLLEVLGWQVGFLVCTELWFFDRARAYGKRGARILAVPRATEGQTVEKWLTAGRSAAVVSGAYCLSSNRVDKRGRPGGMGGWGWVVDPDGQVLAVTSRERPFVTVEIEAARADEAKSTYPRYVLD